MGSDCGCMELSPLGLYALLHLYEVGADYGASLARVAGVALEDAVAVLEELEGLGLAERLHGSAVKNTVAKLKLSSEVRKHHTYYKLTTAGKRAARRLRRGCLAECINESLGEGAWSLLTLLREAGYEHAATLSRLLRKPVTETLELLERLETAGLVSASRPKTLKAKRRRMKPKRETRCHHRYYSLTRLGEMLLRLGGRRG